MSPAKFKALMESDDWADQILSHSGVVPKDREPEWSVITDVDGVVYVGCDEMNAWAVYRDYIGGIRSVTIWREGEIMDEYSAPHDAPESEEF